MDDVAKDLQIALDMVTSELSTALDTIKVLRAERDAALKEVERLRDALKEIIAREDKAWMPMRIFRSEQEAALDEARHEAWTDAADVARAALASLEDKT